MAIEFYKVRDPFGCFSNFSLHPFDYEGKSWPTSEHYFQAHKFITTDSAYAERIRQAETARLCADMGRDRSHPLRPDWDAVKDDVMRLAVFLKFVEHDDIRQVLIDTQDETLIEKTTNDYYWGVGTRGDGKNMLGVILEETRAILRPYHSYTQAINNASSGMEEDMLANQYRDRIARVVAYEDGLLQKLGKIDVLKQKYERQF